MVTQAASRLVGLGSALAVGLAVHTAVNLRQLRRPPRAARVLERVSVLIPARNEASSLPAMLRSVLASTGVDDLEVIVLDDGSTDETAMVASAFADPRLTVLVEADVPPPAGWLGKPWACMRLAERATGSALVFVDADVEVAPNGIAAAVQAMRAADLALVSPYPRQLADSPLERLVQPLVTWSWAATMPVGWAERSTRPSLSAANGQFLAVDATAYRAINGHASVGGEVLEDIALMRAIKRSGQHAATLDGSQIAQCRMYRGSRQVVDGYAKSLWDAFNGPVGSIGVNALLAAAYVVPALGMAFGRSRQTRGIGAIGYAAGVASRAMVARRTGEPVLPDTLAQPASITAFIGLNLISWWRHLRGTNRWKGRPVVGEPA
ncbi:MAG: glycosyltransferase [Actinomycetales bacterium]|nr:glycosyltransferase [Actinomycetales bacterium]